jgi:hypothetical protein
MEDDKHAAQGASTRIDEHFDWQPLPSLAESGEAGTTMHAAQRTLQ